MNPPFAAAPTALPAGVLLLVSWAGLGTMATLRIGDPLLGSMAGEFAATLGQAGLTVSAFTVAYGLALLLYGPLADRIGTLKVVSGATAACALANVACAAAPSLSWLIAFRVLSGIAAAGITPVAMAWIGDRVPYADRQEVLARLIGYTIWGMIAGHLAGGLLADSLGWRAAFLLLAVLFMALAMLMFRATDETAGAADTASVGGRRQAPHRTLGAAIRFVLQHPKARPVLWFGLLEGVLVFPGLAFLPSHLHDRFGVPMSWAAGVLVCYGLGGLVYSRFTGALLRLLGPAGLARAGGVLLCLYFGSLALLPAWIWALPACVIGGCGFYMLHNTLQTQATQMVPEARSTAVTMFSALLFLGHALGVAVSAVVVDAMSAVPVFASAALALPVLALAFAAQFRAGEPRVPRRAQA